MSTSLGESCVFEDAKLVFAFDRTENTEDRTLPSEKKFIRQVLNAHRNPDSARFAAWGDGVSIFSVGLDTLQPNGDSEPSVLLDSTAVKNLIFSSSLWFMMTDARLMRAALEEFAKKLLESGIQGVSCVAVIFGDGNFPPFLVDISVGIPMFALCRDHLFLFCDKNTGCVRILQTKGIFNALLSEKYQASSAEDSRWTSSAVWNEFPLFCVADLHKLSIPAPVKLDPYHVDLGGSHIVDLKDLFGGRKINGITPANLNQIFSKLLKPGGLILASDLLGCRRKFEAWLTLRTLVFEPPLTKAREDVNRRANEAFMELSEALKTGNGVKRPQEKLRAAHEENFKQFLLPCEPGEEAERERARIIAEVEKKTALRFLTDIRALRWLEKPQYTDSQAKPPCPQDCANLTTWGSWCSVVKSAGLRSLLWTPGFNSEEGHTGTCPICDASEVPLTLVFCSPGVPRPDIPTAGTTSRGSTVANISGETRWPLAEWYHQEHRLIDPDGICCDCCAAQLAQACPETARAHRLEPLPMVRYSRNSSAYERRLGKVYGDRRAPFPLLLAFLSNLLAEYKRLESHPPLNMEEGNGQKRRVYCTKLAALKWVCMDLLSSIRVKRKGSDALDLRKPHFMEAAWRISAAFRASICKNSFSKAFLALFQYPLPGFMTALDAATMVGVPDSAVRIAAFCRYLFLLVEAYAAAGERARVALRGGLSDVVSNAQIPAVVLHGGALLLDEQYRLMMASSNFS